MKISEYPYGKPSKSLKNTVNWLNRNKRRLIKEGYLCWDDRAVRIKENTGEVDNNFKE